MNNPLLFLIGVSVIATGCSEPARIPNPMQADVPRASIVLTVAHMEDGDVGWVSGTCLEADDERKCWLRTRTKVYNSPSFLYDTKVTKIAGFYDVEAPDIAISQDLGGNRNSNWGFVPVRKLTFKK